MKLLSQKISEGLINLRKTDNKIVAVTLLKIFIFSDNATTMWQNKIRSRASYNKIKI